MTLRDRMVDMILFLANIAAGFVTGVDRPVGAALIASNGPAPR